MDYDLKGKGGMGWVTEGGGRRRGHGGMGGGGPYRGRGGGGHGHGHGGMGPGGYCVCPKCGFKKPHVAGVPCMQERCPECGSALVRKGSYHHQKIEERRGQKDNNNDEKESKMGDKKPKVKSVHEVVLAVKDAEKAVRLYEELFDLKFDLSWELPWENMKVKACQIGDTQFHIVESTAPDGVIAKFIDRRGEGIHHICFKVEGLGQLIKKFKEKGMKLIPEEPVSFGNVSYIFLHPSQAHGVLIELIEEG